MTSSGTCRWPSGSLTEKRNGILSRNGGSDIGTVQYGESKWMAIPTDWVYQACWGQWRGFAIWRDGGKPYLCLQPAGVGYSGAVSVNHLG